MEYIALDAHKRYSFASVESLDGGKRTEARVENEPGTGKIENMQLWSDTCLFPPAIENRRK